MPENKETPAVEVTREVETPIHLVAPLELAQVIRENMEPRTIEAKRGDEKTAPVLMYPVGMQLASMKKYVDENRLVPERRNGTARLNRINSLIDHINRFKSEASALFASAAIDANSIKAHIAAIFDYHPKGDDVTKADNGKHRALYEFPIAKDFAFWMKNNAKLMGQEEFALFLEERVVEMVSPDDDDKAQVSGLAPKFAEPVEILGLSRDLELYSKETVTQAIKLSSGEKSVKFTTQHVDADGKPIEIPDFFVVCLPLFEGGELHRILVRLRYRKNGERLQWAYDLYRIDRTLEEAFDSACAQVVEATGLPIFHGSDEYAAAVKE